MLPTIAMNIVLNPENNPKGEDYRNLWNNVLPTELNRLERLIAQANTVLNQVTGTYLPSFRGIVTIVGGVATAFNIIHDMGIPAPFTANVTIWDPSGVQVDNSIFTSSTFSTNEAAYTMTAGALGAGAYPVLVLA